MNSKQPEGVRMGKIGQTFVGRWGEGQVKMLTKNRKLENGRGGMKNTLQIEVQNSFFLYIKLEWRVRKNFLFNENVESSKLGLCE